ncbi:MAG: dihydrodipicolinate synthase family protein [Bythopirellula sp.]|nr:dihydrodipicolinate synthase family protein [Bythopirellula sp.]
MTENQSPQFHGIIPPVVTPLVDAEHLDEKGLERLIEHLIAGGVHGLFMLGTTGEAPSLDDDLQRQLIERTCLLVGDRLPVLMGISNTSLKKSIDAAKVAADNGCAAVVAAAPYYMPLEQSELVGYFRQLAAEVPLPLVLYNFPLLTKVSFEPETLVQLLDEPNIVGIKDSSGDLDYFARIVAVAKQRPGFRLLAGKEVNLADIIELGGHGGVTGGANVWPRLFVDLYDAAVARNSMRVAELAPQVVELGKIYAVAGNHFSAGIAGIKMALEVLGICGSTLAQPIQPVTAEDKEHIKEIMSSLNIS